MSFNLLRAVLVSSVCVSGVVSTASADVTRFIEDFGNFPDAVEVTAEFGTFSNFPLNGGSITGTGFIFHVRNTSYAAVPHADLSFRNDPDGDFANDDVLLVGAATAIGSVQPFGMYKFSAHIVPGAGAITSAPAGFGVRVTTSEVTFTLPLTGGASGLLFDDAATGVPANFAAPRTGTMDFFVSVPEGFALTQLPVRSGGHSVDVSTDMAWVKNGAIRTTFAAPGQPFDGERLRPRGELLGVIVRCPGDFNGDGNVNPDDIGDYINCYFAPECPEADFNGDGNIDPDDLGDFINTHKQPCP